MSCNKNFLGTQKQVWISHDKQTINVNSSRFYYTFVLYICNFNFKRNHSSTDIYMYIYKNKIGLCTCVDSS